MYPNGANYDFPEQRARMAAEIADTPVLFQGNLQALSQAARQVRQGRPAAPHNDQHMSSDVLHEVGAKIGLFFVDEEADTTFVPMPSALLDVDRLLSSGLGKEQLIAAAHHYHPPRR